MNMCVPIDCCMRGGSFACSDSNCVVHPKPFWSVVLECGIVFLGDNPMRLHSSSCTEGLRGVNRRRLFSCRLSRANQHRHHETGPGSRWRPWQAPMWEWRRPKFRPRCLSSFLSIGILENGRDSHGLTDKKNVYRFLLHVANIDRNNNKSLTNWNLFNIASN
jgi:hypothetical protein